MRTPGSRGRGTGKPAKRLCVVVGLSLCVLDVSRHGVCDRQGQICPGIDSGTLAFFDRGKKQIEESIRASRGVHTKPLGAPGAAAARGDARAPAERPSKHFGAITRANCASYVARTSFPPTSSVVCPLATAEPPAWPLTIPHRPFWSFRSAQGAPIVLLEINRLPHLPEPLPRGSRPKRNSYLLDMLP